MKDGSAAVGVREHAWPQATCSSTKTISSRGMNHACIKDATEERFRCITRDSHRKVYRATVQSLLSGSLLWLTALNSELPDPDGEKHKFK